MKIILIILTFHFIECYSFVTLRFDGMEKNPLTNLEVETPFEEQKNWIYPVEFKQVKSEGQKSERLMTEFNLSKYKKMDQWLKELRFLFIEPLEEEKKLKIFDEKSFKTLNKTLLKLPILKDDLVLMKYLNILDDLIDEFHLNYDTSMTFSNFDKNNEENGIKSIVNESEYIARIRNFFENLCRKHHSMLSKLKIEHNHYPSLDSNETKKIDS